MKINIDKYKALFRLKKIKTLKVLRMVVVPGFDGMPLYDVLVYFIKGFTKGYLLDRAAGVVFKVFLAIFPAIMVLFTIIPYLPLEGVQTVLLDTISTFLPPGTYNRVAETIEEIISRQHKGLMSIGIIMAFYFSTSSIRAFFRSFDMGVNHLGKITWFKKQLYAIIVMLIFGVLLITSIVLIVIGQNILPWFFNKIHFYNKFIIFLINILRWLFIIFSLSVAIAVLYHFGNPKKNKFRLFTPGSIVFTALFILGTVGFNFYIANFSRYNVLYGSIGALIIFLLWMYLNCILILIGYELNASIALAAIKDKEKPKLLPEKLPERG